MKSLKPPVFLAIVLMFSTTLQTFAQDMPIPILVQARYFKKLFVYNKSIPKDGAKVVIAYSDEGVGVKDDLVQAFTAIGISASAVRSNQLTSGAAGAHAVYAVSAADIRPVRDFCKNKSVLSITGLPKYVNDGEISISIDAVKEQPKVVINAERLKAEKQDAAELIRLR